MMLLSVSLLTSPTKRIMWLYRLVLLPFLFSSLPHHHHHHHHCSSSTTTYAYRLGGIPPINRRAIAGLWKLTPSVSSMKEFTVRKSRELTTTSTITTTTTTSTTTTSSSASSNESGRGKGQKEEVLLMLNEDGSFVRLEESEEQSSSESSVYRSGSAQDVDSVWKEFIRDQTFPNQRNYQGTAKPILRAALFKGTWEYRDGELLLAADRDEQKAKSDNYGLPFSAAGANKNDDDDSADSVVAHPITPQQQQLFWNKGKDTLLKGIVVATPTAVTSTNSHSQDHETTRTTASSSLNNQQISISVPIGAVQVGKFFYPKHHPSFFDQPMYQSQQFGTFQLQQLFRTASFLSSTPAPAPVQEFSNKDFHEKRFVLTIHPLQTRKQPKKDVYKKHHRQQQQQDDDAAAIDEPAIQIMTIQIHSNNTFSTLSGLGDTAVLRGRFNVAGENRDQLWLQTLRFGFGRSVSGSTYSEGSVLGEEKKSFWGRISYDDDVENEHDKTENGTIQSISFTNDSASATEAAETKASTADNDAADNDKRKSQPRQRRLRAEGSVIVGWGLEPQPIARFIMKEAEDDFFDSRDDDDDDDDDEENDETEGDDGSGEDLLFSRNSFQ